MAQNSPPKTAGPNDLEKGKANTYPPRPHGRGESWDLLGGIKKFEHAYGEFDTRHATHSHLVFADGDVPKDKVPFFFQ